MATITPTQSIQDPEEKVIGYTWSPVTENDTCEAIRIIEKDDLTVSINGTVGGTSVALQISNMNATTGFFSAKDASSGNVIALTTTDTASLINEAGVWFKPVLTGGSSTSISITVAGK